MVNLAIIAESEPAQLVLQHFLNAQLELRCTYTSDSVAAFAQKSSITSNVDMIIIALKENAVNKLVPSQLSSIIQAQPKIDILILADCPDTKRIIAWLRAGVVGYLPRDTPLPELKKGILAIHQGGAYLPPFIVRKLLDFFQSQADFRGVLTDREEEMVQCLVEGMSYKLIAARLGIALDTVRYHLRNIYRKLQVNSKSQVISKAVTKDIKV